LFLPLPLVCRGCGADRRVVAVVTETASARRILSHLGEPAEPPRIAPAHRDPGHTDPGESRVE